MALQLVGGHERGSLYVEEIGGNAEGDLPVCELAGCQLLSVHQASENVVDAFQR